MIGSLPILNSIWFYTFLGEGLIFDLPHCISLSILTVHSCYILYYNYNILDQLSFSTRIHVLNKPFLIELSIV